MDTPIECQNKRVNMAIKVKTLKSESIVSKSEQGVAKMNDFLWIYQIRKPKFNLFFSSVLNLPLLNFE